MTPISMFGWALGIASSALILGAVLAVGIIGFAFAIAEARRILRHKE